MILHIRATLSGVNPSSVMSARTALIFSSFLASSVVPSSAAASTSISATCSAVGSGTRISASRRAPVTSFVSAFPSSLASSVPTASRSARRVSASAGASRSFSYRVMALMRRLFCRWMARFCSGLAARRSSPSPRKIDSSPRSAAPRCSAPLMDGCFFRAFTATAFSSRHSLNGVTWLAASMMDTCMSPHDFFAATKSRSVASALAHRMHTCLFSFPSFSRLEMLASFCARSAAGDLTA